MNIISALLSYNQYCGVYVLYILIVSILPSGHFPSFLHPPKGGCGRGNRVRWHISKRVILMIIHFALVCCPALSFANNIVVHL